MRGLGVIVARQYPRHNIACLGQRLVDKIGSVAFLFIIHSGLEVIRHARARNS